MALGFLPSGREGRGERSCLQENTLLIWAAAPAQSSLQGISVLAIWGFHSGNIILLQIVILN